MTAPRAAGRSRFVARASVWRGALQDSSRHEAVPDGSSRPVLIDGTEFDHDGRRAPCRGDAAMKELCSSNSRKTAQVTCMGSVRGLGIRNKVVARKTK